ncbi:hypothetical protein F2Q69_00061228 [Brassica cretica]|uniref:Neprosin PEP catalytic domain-containing protein n=1 Tax=Brassica cretica TaxID=69181 RepID=A0A8S9RC51_BRACR|nr:hypothetical protein F2Q69_00061228 [Brassica cretica]
MSSYLIFTSIILLCLLSSSFSSYASLHNATNESVTFRPQHEIQKLKLIREHLPKINKPAIKTIQSSDGDIIDCVPSHHQPAFDHPLLQGQRPMDPPEIPKGHCQENESHEDFQLWSLTGEFCPEGTIPIRRTTEQDMLRASSVRKFGRKIRRVRRDSSSNGHEHAVGYVSGSKYYGAKASVNVWTPHDPPEIPKGHCQENESHEDFQLWSLTGEFCPEGTIPIRRTTEQDMLRASSVRKFGRKIRRVRRDSSSNGHEHAVGYISGSKYYGAKANVNVWTPHVSPDLYGDTNPRFFTYWTSDAYQATGCYNLLCSGFIQTNNRIAIGAAISPVSSYKGGQFDISLLIWKSSDGDIIDCVPSHHQPAFDHPLLQGQRPMDPPEIPKGHCQENESHEDFQLWSLTGEFCPEGTIPIRRTTEQDMLRASSVRKFGRKIRRVRRDSSSNGHEHAVGYVSGSKYYGAKASVNVWTPHVSPELYGDTNPRFFTYWTSDAYQATGCYNLLCSGFIQTNNRIAIGAAISPVSSYKGGQFDISLLIWKSDAYQATGCYNLLCSGFIQTNNRIAIGAAISPVSSYKGGQFDISLLIWKDPKHGHWWLQFGSGTLVGYWPVSLFTHLMEHGNMVQFGGEIVNAQPDGSHTSTQMGSGHFAGEGFGKASYFRNLEVVDWDNTLIPISNLRVLADHPNCYDIRGGVNRTNNRIAIGAAISPVSSYKGGQFDISLLIWKDPKHGHWWLQFGSGTLVGYWPVSLFTHLMEHGNMVQFGGEVVNTRPDGSHTSTQMGSGHFAGESFGQASYFRNLEVVDWDNTLIPISNLRVLADHPNCYDIRGGVNRVWGNYFYYGGPGTEEARPDPKGPAKCCVM